MALTRANVENVLVSRCAATLRTAGLDAATQNGSNASLNDPIATALEELGLAAADRPSVADGDLAPLVPAAQPRLLDLAEIRTLETCLNQILTQPTLWSTEDFKTDRKTWIKDTMALIDWKWSSYRARYAANTAPAVGQMRHASRHELRDRAYWWPYPPYEPY